MAGGEIRRLFVTLGLRDTLTPKLAKINQLTNQTAMRMAAATVATTSYGAAGASLATFFTRIDTAERMAIIRGTHQSRVVRGLIGSYHSLKLNAGAYATSFTQRMTALNGTLEQHRMKLLLVGGALAGVVGLTLKSAIAEEKYRANVKSLAGVIDYQAEGQEAVNKALQDYISLAEKLDYVSKSERALLTSQLALMGASKQTILEYGPILERFGVSIGVDTETAINAVKSALTGMPRAMKNTLGITTVTEEAIKAKIEEIRDAHEGWSEDALRVQAVMEVAYPQMVAKIGEFDAAVDNAYADSVKLKASMSDLAGDIGSQYLPLFRSVVDIMTRFTQAIQTRPILAKAVAIGTLTAAVVVLGGLALPLVIKSYTFWKGLTIWHTVAQSGLAATLMTRLIPAQVAAAYSTGGLSAAFSALAVATWAAMVPLLPFIAVGMALAGVILLLQDLAVKGWKDSYMGKFFAWMLNKLPFLKPIVEQVSKAFKYLKWIIFPLLGPLASIFVIAKNWQKIKGIVSGVGASIRDKLSGTIIKAKKDATDLFLLFTKTRTGGVVIDIVTKMRRGDLLGVLKGVPTLAKAYVSDVLSIFEWAGNRIGKLFGIEDVGTRIVTGFKNIVTRITEFFSRLPALFRDAGSKMILALVEGMKTRAMLPVRTVEDILMNVRPLLPFSDPRAGPLSDLTASGQSLITTFSRGMQIEQPKLAVDFGRILEPFSPPRPGPAPATAAAPHAPSATAPATTVNVGPIYLTVHEAGNVNKTKDAVINTLRREFMRAGVTFGL